MPNRNVFTTLLILGLSAFIFISCGENGEDGKDGDIPTPPSPETLAESIEQATLPLTPSTVEESVDTVDQGLDISAQLICKTIEVSAQGATGDYRTFDPNSDVIWPGNILQGNTITRGTPEVVDVERAAGTFTIDLVNGSKGTKVEVPKVTQPNVIEGINNIIDSNSGVLPSNFTYTFREVRSRQELALAMRVNAGTFTSEFEGKISARTSNESHSVLVDFVQKYYTIAYQTPTSYEGFFAEGVDGKDLAPYVGPNNPPVFIKSVTYGRRYYLMITSTASSTEIEASIRASYDAATFDADLDADATYVGELEDVQISVFAMGGDAQRAAATFGGDFNAVREFLTEGGSIETGVPLSYKMETVAEPHQDVGIGLATNFTVNNCQPAGLPDYAKGWFGIFDGEGISAAVVTQYNGDDVLLFNKAGTEYAEIRGGEIVDVNTLGAGDNGRLAGCPIDTVGAAHGLTGQIRIYSKDGMQYTVQEPGSPDWWAVRTVSQMAGGTHPFKDPSGGGPAGVGAVLQGPNTGGSQQSIHFNMVGNRWTRAIGSGFQQFNTLNEWGGSGYDLPFAKVGAAVRIFRNGRREEVLFNGEGTHFVIYTGSDPNPRVYQIGNDPE